MELDVTEAQLNRYNSGRFTLQDCFPNLSADEREFIKSGITADEWEETFGQWTGLDYLLGRVFLSGQLSSGVSLLTFSFDINKISIKLLKSWKK